MTSPFLSSNEAAAYLGKSRKSLHAFLKAHPVRVYRLGGSCRYHIDDIKALIEFSHISTDPVSALRPSEAKPS